MSGSEGKQGGGEAGRFEGGSEIDQKRCPLCGETNGCGMAAGKGDCWCKGVKIAAEVLAEIPAEARERACICERCATGTRRALMVPVLAGDRAR